jgi:hypothetical protein
LFVVVLTMISGARELMTPGAWKRDKDRLTYSLADGNSAQEYAESLSAARIKRISRLGSELAAFAESHHGRYPTREEMGQIDDESWKLPDPAGLRYIYLPDRERAGSHILAYEPNFYEDESWALMTDGSLEQLSIEEIEQRRAMVSP